MITSFPSIGVDGMGSVFLFKDAADVICLRSAPGTGWKEGQALDELCRDYKLSQCKSVLSGFDLGQKREVEPQDALRQQLFDLENAMVETAAKWWALNNSAKVLFDPGWNVEGFKALKTHFQLNEMDAEALCRALRRISDAVDVFDAKEVT